MIIDEFEEKEIMFRMEVGDEVVGKTINLLEAIKKGIDCVFIRLNEVLSETEMYELIDVKNEIAGVGCQIIGFPKLASQRTTMLATISNTQEEQLIVNIKKENQLQNYEGVSGAPVIALGNIVCNNIMFNRHYNIRFYKKPCSHNFSISYYLTYNYFSHSNILSTMVFPSPMITS